LADNNKKENFRFSFEAPKPVYQKISFWSPSKRVPRGIANDRMALRMLNNADNGMLALQQIVEMNDLKENVINKLDINVLLRKKAMLDIHEHDNKENINSFDNVQKRKKQCLNDGNNLLDETSNLKKKRQKIFSNI